MPYLVVYLVVGMIVAVVVYSRRNRPREKEIGAVSSPIAPRSLVGRSDVVVIPLTPLGRISIEGVHRDARAEFGDVPKDALVVVCAHGIGSELVVKWADQPPQRSAGSRPH